MTIEPYNFITVRLCDNDYGLDIAAALNEMNSYWGCMDRVCPTTVKMFVIEHIIEHHCKASILREGKRLSPEEEKSTRTYLEKIKVTFDRHAPTDDHDGGSACFNVNMKTVWTF